MIIIRNAKIEDIEGIAKVLKESYNVDDIEEAKQVFREELKKGHYYIVAEQIKTILGIVTWTIHDLPKHQLAELNRIAVLPEFRGKGVSKLLFNGLIKKCNEYYKEHGFRLRKLYLLTHESNTRAHGFYEKIGFKHETTLDNHYYEGEDEYVYSIFFDEEGNIISNPSNKN
ncbi:unnamed protein product [marine sediment metagenome]|uniref:N-acetyltransferase domain-containing protein n=1 Tax=marine sediment metagenome TaxID=412755 RepID=X0US13_9ZZZZ